MQYNGGKTRIAKDIAAIVNRERGPRFVWEPFCGGLSVTAELKPQLASDAHPGLIALYNKIREFPGFLDGFECTREAYYLAKTWPDTDPAKAFIGFGCSFGGKWFGGYGSRQITAKNPHTVTHNSRKRLLANLAACPDTSFKQLSFFDIQPQAGFLIYADPPYAGTTAYAGVAPFNSAAFFELCNQWARYGSIVYISEYAAPIGALVWEKEVQGTLGSGVNAKQHRPLEKLFRVAL